MEEEGREGGRDGRCGYRCMALGSNEEDRGGVQGSRGGAQGVDRCYG